MYLSPLLKKAQKYLQSAAVLLELEDFDSCASRAYFAMVYAAEAMLVADGHPSPGPQALSEAFTRTYVHGGLLPDRAAVALNYAAEAQQRGDLSAHFAVTRVQAEHTLQEAEAFVNSIDRLIAINN
jgi:uncharacterized protein (UPF0332 family)